MRSSTVKFRRIVLLGRRAHGDRDAYLAGLLGEDLGLALAGRRVALLGAAARALRGRVFPLSLAALPPQLLAPLEALYEPRVENVLLGFPRVVLGLPAFPFHVVLDFVLKGENIEVIRGFISS